MSLRQKVEAIIGTVTPEEINKAWNDIIGKSSYPIGTNEFVDLVITKIESYRRDKRR